MTTQNNTPVTQDSTLIINNIAIPVGKTVDIELPVAKLYTNTDIHLPIRVIRGKQAGATVFISAAIHGDELNGIEIIRRLINRKIQLIKGTLILVPMVNVYGVLNKSRYMPDRRDLNRSFPGSTKGSLTSRVAYQFLQEIVNQCDYGIDLHTGAIHRSNLPQIRANLQDPETLAMAKRFGVPVVLNANLRDGSLRQCASEQGCRILLYEAGEALRFDELSIRGGVRGVINTLKYLGMIKNSKAKKSNSKKTNAEKTSIEPIIANKSSWMRASESGIAIFKRNLGERVSKYQVLAQISDPFGTIIGEVVSSKEGIIIGKQNIPLVQEGDAIYHIAYFDTDNIDEVEDSIESFEEHILNDE